MNADERDGIHVMETERIIGCAFTVLNALGHGYPSAKQINFPLYFRGVRVCNYIPDSIVFGRVVVERMSEKTPRQGPTSGRSSNEITAEQSMKCLKIGLPMIVCFPFSRTARRSIPAFIQTVTETNTIERITYVEVGRLLNFKHAKFQFRRVTLTPPQAPLLHS